MLMSSRVRRRLWIVGGVLVWLAGIAACIGAAFADPKLRGEAAGAAAALIVAGVVGTASKMIAKGLNEGDDGHGS